MTHLKIEQNNGIIEEVSSAVIDKLYDIVHSGNLDNTSNLIGRLHTSATYQDYIDYLEDTFKVNGVKQLIIDSTKKYIRFTDPAVLSRMLQYLGDGVGITNSEITNGNWYSNTTDPNTNSTLFTNNTSIISFNELGLLSLITNIPSNTFKGCTNLTSIDLSNVTSLGNYAFSNCSALTNVGNLSNIISISTLLFQNCSSLASVDLSNVTSIGDYAFQNCSSLTSVGDLSNVISIGRSVFYGCLALTTIDLSNVTSIGESTFANCSALITIDLSNTTSIDNYAFLGCSLLTTVDSPNITSIGYNVFLNCSSLANIDLSNCTSIGNNSFLNCSSLVNVDLSSCISLGNSTFLNCSSLTSVNLPNVISIGSYAFSSCSSLVSVNLPNVTTIDYSTFRNCNNLTTLDLSSVTSIGDHAFTGCTSLTQFPCDPSIVTQIWESAFENCTNMGLDTILELNLTLLTKCPQYSFKGTKFKGLILHWPSLSNLTFDGRYNIWESMKLLEYLDMSDTIAPICDNDSINLYRGFGFYDNPNITTAVFPATVNYLSDSIFTLRASVDDNTKYKYLILLSTTPPYLLGNSNTPVSIFFRNRPALNIYVPDSVLQDYLSDTNWLQLGDNTNNFNLSDRVKGLSQLPAGVWTTGLASSYLTPAQLLTS